MNLKTILSVAILATTVFTMTGCKGETVQNTGMTQEELDEYYSDKNLQNGSVIKGNYNDLTPEEAIEFEEFVKNFHNDMKKTVFENKEARGKEVDLSTLGQKYFVKDYNNVNVEGFYKDLHNVYDGYDGTIDNKLTDAKEEKIGYTETGYIDYSVITDAFNKKDSDGWFNIEPKEFSEVKVKMDDLKDDAWMMVYNAGQHFDGGIGLFHRAKKSELSTIVFDDYDMKQDKLLAAVVTFEYDFENDYPYVDKTDINKAINEGADTLEVMFVKTNDGWKCLFSKFVITTAINQIKE